MRPIEVTENLGVQVTEADVEFLFQAILGRPVNDDMFKQRVAGSPLDLGTLVQRLCASDELRARLRAAPQDAAPQPDHRRDPLFFRCPQDLTLTQQPVKRILILGSCLSEMWANKLASLPDPCASDLYLNGELPEAPARPIGDYDFQIVQIPLRAVLPDGAFAKLAEGDSVGHERLFQHCVAATRRHLVNAMRWNRSHGILSFVFPFLPPQQNAVGRLMPRFRLTNPVYFIEKLNEALGEAIASYENTYYFDLNEVIASHGRRYFQEDGAAAINHGAYFSDYDFHHDGNRLEPSHRASELFEERVHAITLAAWHELLAMLHTVRGTDAVKLVVIDLDDTLWRGVIAERADDDLPSSGGWPRGLWEALAFLKRRGILLAIISKNEESRVREAWDGILGRNLSLDDFAIHRINWRPKSENMAEILAHVNLLPRNVVYIDDNPAIRNEIKAVYPDIRVLGGTPLTWRHILLWSAETQLPTITAESAARTEMVRAQVAREAQRQTLSAAEFLATLNVRMNLFEIDEISHSRFSRVLELINKTNQFNTTGKRWTREECVSAFAAGAGFHAFELSDAYTDYGLVGVLITDDAGIVQFVMSCRIMGLEAEIAAVAQITEILRARGAATIFAAMVETERNLPCREIYSRAGFEPTAGGWRRATVPPLSVPAHIALERVQPPPLRVAAETRSIRAI